MADIVVELPKELRLELKEPLGPIYTDTPTLVADASQPLIAIGDVVTHHLIKGGETPKLAMVDERTERSAVSPEIAETINSFEGFGTVEQVSNPAGTLSAELLTALRTGLEREGSTLLDVDGEEDLAALPTILVAPEGTSLVYGQPGEGMVLTAVEETARQRCRDILSRMDGDTARLWDLLGVDA
ncbi:GTP-dependent dephospho-CoA kinase family protein [Halovenus sp. HT40]|uniref:GTP-dependent dephospho-CoA kinase family protein n=1 Tax=Halovenus sp. HT40 TaxID=3126691 RepID=UPI00300E8F88